MGDLERDGLRWGEIGRGGKRRKEIERDGKRRKEIESDGNRKRIGERVSECDGERHGGYRNRRKLKETRGNSRGERWTELEIEDDLANYLRNMRGWVERDRNSKRIG